MVNLTRRSFLKAIGITSAGLILPSFDILFPKVDVIPKFRLRILAGYDIYDDLDILRIDVSYSNNQLHVSSLVYSEGTKDRDEFINRFYNPMVIAIKNELIHRKIPPSKLIPLPYPPGYQHPNWLRDFLNA